MAAMPHALLNEPGKQCTYAHQHGSYATGRLRACATEAYATAAGYATNATQRGATRRYATLRDATRRYATLRDATRQSADLRDAARRYATRLRVRTVPRLGLGGLGEG